MTDLDQLLGVEFEDKGPKLVKRPKFKKSGLIAFLISRGIVKTPAQANILLIILTLVFFSLSVFFFFIAGNMNSSDNESYRVIQKTDQTPFSNPIPATSNR